MELLGLYGPLKEGSRWAKLRGKMQHVYQTSLGHTIAGGTSEVLRRLWQHAGLVCRVNRERGAERMDFRLTEQQALLVNTARAFFAQHCPTTLVQLG